MRLIVVLWSCFAASKLATVDSNVSGDTIGGSNDRTREKERVYEVFRIPAFLGRPDYLADRFLPPRHPNPRIDVFVIDSEDVFEMADEAIEEASRRASIVVSRRHRGKPLRRERAASNPKISSLIVVCGSSDLFDLDELKIVYGRRWNTRARVLLLAGFTARRTPAEILRDFWLDDLLDVALSASADGRTGEIGARDTFVYDPFAANGDGDRGVATKLTDTEPMFPDKLVDMRGYPLPISVFNQFPKARLTKLGELRNGADVETLLAVSRKLNFRIDLKTDPAYIWSYVVELQDGERVGTVGDVLLDRSVAVWNSQFVESANGRRVEFAYPTLQASYCVLVPKGRIMPMLLRMLHPLPFEIWLGVVAVSVYLVVFMRITGQKRKLLRVCELLLYQRLGRIEGNDRQRISSITWIWWACLIGSIYQGCLIKEIALPRYFRDIDTLEQLYESGLPVMVGDNLVEVLNKSELPSLKRLATRTFENLVLTDCVSQLLRYANVSCAAERHVAGLHSRLIVDSIGVPRIHLMNDCLSVHWETYVVKYGLPYLEKIDKYVRRVVEAGLYQKWVKDRVERRIEVPSPVVRLTLRHFEGVFVVLAECYLIVVVTFAAELIVHRVSSRCRRDSSNASVVAPRPVRYSRWEYPRPSERVPSPSR